VRIPVKSRFYAHTHSELVDSKIQKNLAIASDLAYASEYWGDGFKGVSTCAPSHL
jgi:hypothetical protein